MARTRSANYEDVQLGILSKAARLFAKNGYERTSVSDLVGACGLSRGAIYHYFDSKEAILFAMLDKLVRSLLERLEAARSEGGSPADKLLRVVEEFFLHNASSPDEQVILLNDLGALSKVEQKQIVELEKMIVDLIAEVIIENDERKKLSGTNRKIYTMMFIGIINYTYTWYDPKGDVKPRELARLATDLFLNGFLAESRHSKPQSAVSQLPLRRQPVRG